MLKPKSAEPAFMNTTSPQSALNEAKACLGAGRAGEALSICQRVLALRPDEPEALAISGGALHALGRYSEAVHAFSALVRLSPQLPRHWSNLATSLRSSGQLDTALIAYRKAESLGLRTPDLFLNLGLLHLERGEIADALPILQWGAAIAPQDAELRYHYAHCCHECVLDDNARRALDGWQTWSNLDATLLARLGSLLVLLGETAQAEAALKRALQQEPANAKALIEYAALLERVNRLDEAQLHLNSIPTTALSDPDLTEKQIVLGARLAERSGQLEDACTGYEHYAAALMQPHRKHHALYPLAKTLDAMGRTAQAFEALKAAHAAQMRQIAMIAPEATAPGREPLRIVDYGCATTDVSRWLQLPGPGPERSPIFVVAFPRSGTTLLEQVLDAHPLLASMDEQTYVQDAIEDIKKLGVRYPESLGDLTAVQCEQLRQKYWLRVATRVQLAPNQRLVDKNPLNLLRLPVIRRLFPEATYILAIRHPCDVVLSNYMQHFRAPEIAALCRDLPTLARGFRRAFDFWYQEAALLRPRVMELRYEDLVGDFETWTRRLVDFLGVTLDQAMLSPSEHARRRGFISTPSYSQVVQPVNTRAVDRWRRYETQLLPILEELQLYLDRWGYRN